MIYATVRQGASVLNGIFSNTSAEISSRHHIKDDVHMATYQFAGFEDRAMYAALSKNAHMVEQLMATSHHVKVIRRFIKGIPMSPSLPTETWFGDDAKYVAFQLRNLILLHK